MSETKVKISELPLSTETSGLTTIGVNAQGESVQIPIGTLLGQTAPLAQAAQQAAQQAQEDAEAAVAAASSAEAKANTALQKATNTEALADNANQRSNAAKTAAEGAQTAANNANSTSTAAQQTAQAAQQAAQQAQGAVAVRMFVNVDQLLGSVRNRLLETVLELISARTDASAYRVKGVVLTFTGRQRQESWQWNGSDWNNASNWKPYRYDVVEVASESAMEALISGGTTDDTTMYFIPEE